MRDRWNATEAPPPGDALASCVYGSRLLGAEAALVLHGGGNTSVKATATDITGEPVEVLYVKGSGWDLATIEPAGFAPLRLAAVRRLLTLERLDDATMMGELRCASLRADAPDPSVESLLHALLPYPAVQHSHADALIALTNQPEPEALVREVYGGDVVVVPYVMPGFDLARACARIFPEQATPETVGMVLLNHGLFTFGADTEQAYRRHIALISRAERFLAERVAPRPAAEGPTPTVGHLRLARLRRDISDAAGAPMITSRHDDARIRTFVSRPNLASVATRGPATPDHVIRTKRVPLVGDDVSGYAAAYRGYFDDHRDRAAVPRTMLDPAPRVLLDPAFGMVTAGRRARDADIAYDIYSHTIDIIDNAEGIGTYTALPAADLFDVEYWDLEQAKLHRGGRPPEFAGEVALVTGAASGIGRACAQALLDRGAAVAGLDVDARVAEVSDRPDYLGIEVDVTDAPAVDAAIAGAVERFGGVDVVVAAAGIFGAGAPLAELDLAGWRRTMAVNVDAIAHLFSRVHPLLALAPRGGRVVVIGSRNVPAPGPGAAAYSASKAAVTQLARVAALEWASDGIRVNTVHPDAVFDTGLWTDDVIAARARHYGLTVEQYKRRNLLSAEITSAQVGKLVATLCSDAFAVTTGAQIPVDGGSDRVV